MGSGTSTTILAEPASLLEISLSRRSQRLFEPQAVEKLRKEVRHHLELLAQGGGFVTPPRAAVFSAAE